MFILEKSYYGYAGTFAPLFFFFGEYVCVGGGGIAPTAKGIILTLYSIFITHIRGKKNIFFTRLKLRKKLKNK